MSDSTEAPEDFVFHMANSSEQDSIHPELDHKYLPEVTEETLKEIADHEELADNISFEERPNAELLTQAMKREREENAIYFEVQFSTLQGWFVRASWVQKYRFISEILEDNNESEFLKYVLRTIGTVYSKDVIYSTSQYVEAFTYDMVPHDHNRALNSECLASAVLGARQWISKLSDVEKLKVLGSLLLLSGGAMIKRIYMDSIHTLDERERRAEELRAMHEELLRMFELAREEHLKREMEAKERSSSSESLFPDMVDEGEWDDSSSSSDEEETGMLSLKKSHVKIDEDAANEGSKPVTEDGESDEGDPDHPLFVMARFALDQWESRMATLRERYKVDEREPVPIVPIVATSTLVIDPLKKRHSVMDEHEDENLDQIQMLPLGVSRRIIKLLPNKDLKNVRRVNTYWEDMVEETTVEVKARQKIQGVLNKRKKYSGIPRLPPRLGRTHLHRRSSLSYRSYTSMHQTSSTTQKSHLTIGSSNMTVKSFPPPQIEPELGPLALEQLVGEIDKRQMKDVFAKTVGMIDFANSFFYARVTACCPESRLVAVSTIDNAVELFYAHTGQQVAPRLVGHEGHITCMAFHPYGGNLLLTGSTDKTARLWDVWQQYEMKVYSEHNRALISLGLDGNYFISASIDKVFRVVDLWSRQCLIDIKEDYPVTAVAIRAATNMAFAGLQTGEIHIYDYMENVFITSVPAHTKAVTCLHLRPPLLASGGYDGYTRVWDSDMPTPNCLVSLPAGAVQTVWLTGHHLLVSGTNTGVLRAWNIATGRSLTLMRGMVTWRSIKHLGCTQDETTLKIIVGTETGVQSYSFTSRPSQAYLDALANANTSSMNQRVTLAPPPPEINLEQLQQPETDPAPALTKQEIKEKKKEMKELKLEIKKQQKLDRMAARGKSVIQRRPADGDIIVLDLSYPMEQADRRQRRQDNLRRRQCVDERLRVAEQNERRLSTTHNIVSLTVQYEPFEFVKLASSLKLFKRYMAGDPGSYELPMKLTPWYRTRKLKNGVTQTF